MTGGPGDPEKKAMKHLSSLMALALAGSRAVDRDGFQPPAEHSKAEGLAHSTEGPADPYVCNADVLGMDMMGDELDGDELDGDELDGDDDGVVGDVLGMALVGAAKRRRALRRAAHGGARAKPRWRNRLAPGVPTPDYGVFPVPLTPLTNNGIFTSAISNITYSTIAQVPFRGERLLTRVARSGAASSNVFAQNGVFIGIRPQTGVLGPLNLENYSSTAFGVRMVMQPAEQGAQIQVFAFVNPAITGTADTLALSIEILGRVVR